MNFGLAPRAFLLGEGLKVWTNPHSAPNIIVLCRSSLYISNIAAKDLNIAVDRLCSGAVPEQVFGTYMREISLISVDWVEVDLRHNRFRFHYFTGLGTCDAEFQLSHAHDANELMAVLQKQLGDKYLQIPLGFRLTKTCGLPLLGLVVHAGICLLGWLILHPLDGLTRRKNVWDRWMQDVVGDEGMMIFGVTIGIGLLLWMAMRIIDRPGGTRFEKSDASVQ